jgi:hypothetical protein
MCIASILPFLTMKVNSTELRDIAAYEFVKLLGDGERPGKWALDVSTQTVRASYAWSNLNHNGSGKIIAILDSGMNETHPGLVGKIIGHVDYMGTGFGDFVDHGTHVAGIAAGTGADSPAGHFCSGVAPGAWLLNVKIGDDYPVPVNAVNGINWALQHNANVISLSFGWLGGACNCHKCAVCTVVKSAVERGVTIVICAGNEGPLPRSVSCPGCSEEAITVGAINDLDTPSISDDIFCNDSGRGPNLFDKTKPDVVAPGENIMSPNTFGGYNNFWGTSAAAPHVAGVAALILQAHPNWTPEMVKYAIKGTANLNVALQLLLENDRGKGIVDAVRAISYGTEIPPDRAESKYENNWGNSGVTAYYNGTMKLWAAGTIAGDARAEARLNKTFTPSRNVSNPVFFFGFRDLGKMEADLGNANFYTTLKLWQGNTLLANTEQELHSVGGTGAYIANCSHTLQLIYQGTLFAGQQYKIEYGFWTYAHLAWSNFYDYYPSAGITVLHLTIVGTMGIRNPSFEERDKAVNNAWYWSKSGNGWRNVRGDLGGGNPTQWGLFDGICNYKDLSLFQQAYTGQYYGPYRWYADLNGDGNVNWQDCSIIINSYNYDTPRYVNGLYSWYTSGSGDYNMSQWLSDNDVNAIKGHQINFSFWFKPENITAYQSNARAEIHYILDDGTYQKIFGNWINATQNTWYNPYVQAVIPTNAIATRIVIHGAPNFKTWIDYTQLVIQ